MIYKYPPGVESETWKLWRKRLVAIMAPLYELCYNRRR